MNVECIGCFIDAPSGRDHHPECLLHVWKESYSPAWAPHVEGSYSMPRKVREDGLPEEQTVECVCKKCGSTWQTKCASGNVRQHIARFANAHYHRDALRR